MNDCRGRDGSENKAAAALCKGVLKAATNGSCLEKLPEPARQDIITNLSSIKNLCQIA